jgi:hypothetical protein
MNQPTQASSPADITFALILQITMITAFILMSITYFYNKRRNGDRKDK